MARKRKVDALVEYAAKTQQAAFDKHYSEAVAIHNVPGNRTSSNILSEIKDYNDPTLTDRGKVVDLSRKLRSNEGVCASVADLIVDFAASNGSFFCDNEEVQNNLNKWADVVNSQGFATVDSVVFPVPGLRELSRKIMDSYITDGDAVFTAYWQKADIDEKLKGIFMPIAIKTIDTKLLSIDKDLASIGIEQLSLKLPDALIDKLSKPKTDSDKYLVKLIPKEWMKFIKDKKEIILDPLVTYHLKRNGKDYGQWGVPLFQKVFTAIAAKRRLQAVDEHTIDGLINRLTFVKIGLPDKEKNPAYHVPSKERISQLVNLITSPKRINLIVWPGPDLEVVDIGSDGKILEFVDKYKQVDADIIRALHVPPLLIDGTSTGQSARDWSVFMSTEAGIDTARSALEKLYTEIAKKMAIQNKWSYDKFLYFRFDSMALKNPDRVRNFAIKMYELGAISTQTFITIMGYDYNTELHLKEKEVSEGLENIFVNRTLPYQGQGAPTSTKDGGRPDNTPTDDSKPAVKAFLQSSIDTDTYIAIYCGLFDKMKHDVLAKAHHNLLDKETSEATFHQWFTLFRMIVNEQLGSYFDQTIKSDKAGKYRKDLVDWGNSYIDKLETELLGELASSYEDYSLFVGRLDSFYYRFILFAKESKKKAVFTAQITDAMLNGFKFAVPNCKGETTCELATKINGTEIPIEDAFNSFPAHPSCTCKLIFK